MSLLKNMKLIVRLTPRVRSVWHIGLLTGGTINFNFLENYRKLWKKSEGLARKRLLDQSILNGTELNIKGENSKPYTYTTFLASVAELYMEY